MICKFQIGDLVVSRGGAEIMFIIDMDGNYYYVQSLYRDLEFLHSGYGKGYVDKCYVLITDIFRKEI